MPLLRMQWPEVVDMNMPLEGVFHNCVIVSIDKRYPMQARRLMSAFWGAGQMSFVKTIVVVDSDVDVHNEKTVLTLLLNEIDLDTDLFFSEGILDVLNHASDRALYGSKLGIDATRKLEGEPEPRPKQALPSQPEESIATHIKERFTEITSARVLDLKSRRTVLMVSMEKSRPHQAGEFIKNILNHENFKDVGILLVFEAHVELANDSQVLWKLFNNLDPRRDIYRVADSLGVDLSRKQAEEGYQQDWPEEIIMSPEIKKQVDEKQARLGIG